MSVGACLIIDPVGKGAPLLFCSLFGVRNTRLLTYEIMAIQSIRLHPPPARRYEHTGNTGRWVPKGIGQRLD
jgi:hypothetical protein